LYKDGDIAQIKVCLEVVKTPEQREIYKWIRLHTSKLRSGQSRGRNIKIIVKDEITDKILGLMELADDFLALQDRDEYIGWTQEIRRMNRRYIMNLSCCVPVQPFGYNYCGGKLLAQLAFSREIYDIFFNIYKTPLLGILTTSINGKSVQYDRIKNLKFLGYTKGYGSTHIPLELFKKASELLKREFPTEYQKATRQTSSKRVKMIMLTTKFNIDTRILTNCEERGIYFGYTFSNSKTLLNSEEEKSYMDSSSLKSVEEIFQNWLLNRALKRKQTLESENRFRIDDNLYFLKNISLHEERNIRDKKLRNKKRIEMGDEEYKKLESSKRKERRDKQKAQLIEDAGGEEKFNAIKALKRKEKKVLVPKEIIKKEPRIKIEHKVHVANSKQRKIDAIGKEEYNKMMAEKRKEQRQRKKKDKKLKNNEN